MPIGTTSVLSPRDSQDVTSASDRPVDVYRVLGLNPLENDVATIRAIAGERWLDLQTERDGIAPEAWDEMNRQLQDAVGVLLDPNKKAAYDNTLRVQSEYGPTNPQPSDDIDGEGSDSMICRKCGTACSSSRKFCGNCGASLWESCVGCGTVNRSDEKFCGSCGADLASRLREKIASIENSLQEADRLRADGEYFKAAELLETLKNDEHPRLAEYADRAADLIEQFAAERVLREREAAEAHDKAQECIEQSDYSAAMRVLEAVPTALRTDEANELADAVRERIEEIATLGNEIRAAVASNKMLDLLPKLDRLLELQPNHAQAKLITEKVEKVICRSAQELLAGQQYDAALELLDRVPESLETLNVLKLRKFASELSWLFWDLRNAPVVDATLRAVAERLVKLAPRDKQAVKLSAELARRIEKAAGKSPDTLITWSPPPEKTSLGRPVDWLTGFRRIEVSKSVDASVLAEHKSRLYVAAGLALDGIGKSALGIRLDPAATGGLLGRARRAIRKRAAATAWGIDLGPTGLKAVKLTRNDQTNSVTIDACEAIEHAKALTQAVDLTEERKLVEETIETFRSRHNTKGERLCLGLPGVMTMGKQITLPPMDVKKAHDAAQYEVRTVFPCNPADLVWDYRLIDKPGDEDSTVQREILMVAVRRDQLTTYLERVAGLQVGIVQSDCLALHNLICYEHFSFNGEETESKAGEDVPVVVLDAGSDGSNIVVCSPRLLWFRNIATGGTSFTKALMREFKLTYTQAEELKRDISKVRQLGRVNEVLGPVFEDFSRDVQSSMTFFENAHRKTPIDRYLVTGGSLELHGLIRHLRTGR